MTATTASRDFLQDQAMTIQAMNTTNKDTAAASLGDLSCDVWQQLANSYLSPLERSRLSSCSSRLHRLLPSLLQIKIVASTTRSLMEKEEGNFQSLWQGFFVCPADECDYRWNSTSTSNSIMSRSLKATDSLLYGQRYYFWTFDYSRGNMVYLGRHARHGWKDDSGSLQHWYSIGLRPRSPDQTWEVVAADSGSTGEMVQWGEDVGLSVGGNKHSPRLPDSTERSFLSCMPALDLSTDRNNTQDADHHDDPNSGSAACWCTIGNAWGPSERLQLIPMDQFVPGPDVEEKQLSVHAIPEACDEGEYLLYNPVSLEDGLPTSDGSHVAVRFDFWIEKGIMYFQAPVLPFVLGIPILEADYPTNTSPTSPIANLLHIKSARWGCLIYYMAVAADVTEGKKLDMNRFLRRITDHPDHTVKVNDVMDLVYIDVRCKKLKQDAANSTISPQPFNTPTSWCFVLSW
jgi:hypothetical protein